MVKKCANPKCLAPYLDPTTPGCNCEIEGFVADGKYVGSRDRSRERRRGQPAGKGRSGRDSGDEAVEEEDQGQDQGMSLDEFEKCDTNAKLCMMFKMMSGMGKTMEKTVAAEVQKQVKPQIAAMTEEQAKMRKDIESIKERLETGTGSSAGSGSIASSADASTVAPAGNQMKPADFRSLLRLHCRYAGLDSRVADLSDKIDNERRDRASGDQEWLKRLAEERAEQHSEFTAVCVRAVRVCITGWLASEVSRLREEAVEESTGRKAADRVAERSIQDVRKALQRLERELRDLATAETSRREAADGDLRQFGRTAFQEVDGWWRSNYAAAGA